jgi:flagellar basal-body rod protein FlgF
LGFLEGDQPLLKNIYGPLSAGKGQERVLEILANNIANSNTTGFKEQEVSFQAMMANPWPAYSNPQPPAPFKNDMSEVYPLHGNEMGTVAVSSIRTNFSQGSLRETKSPLDVALQGNGFFVVETAFGERFTRDGSFTLTSDGTLVTRTGGTVAGESGPLTGLAEGDLRINQKGEVYLGDRFIDRLRVVSFADPELLERVGDNTFVHDGAPENVTAFRGEVTQGFLEGANVNPMKNMANLITAHRTYEALQKAVQAHDKTMEKGSNEIGAVRGG